MLTALVGLVVAPSLYLVPTPQSLVQRAGSFSLAARSDLVVARPADEDDSFAAEQLIAERAESFGWRGRRAAAQRVLVGQIGRDRAITSALRSLKLKLPTNAGADAYILTVRRNQVVCAGASAAGTYYAVQTLKQLVRTSTDGTVPALDIVDWPSLQIRGWQDDISRGPIPKLDFLKKQVRELSEYKLNAFTLYTEHVFKLRKHPKIAPADGIIAEEVTELDRYCKKHHVQLIGNFQSFGHFANILRVPGYEGLKETNDVITPAKEESYKFLADVYSEVAPAYASNLFNINCDETYGLGEGPAKAMVEKDGLGNVYAKHINRVSGLLKPYGKTPMMWGDIALQYPSIRASLPKDLIVLTWGYDPRASFVDQIEPFTKIGFRFLVCPGVSCWGQTFPDLEAATTNINNFVRDGAALGAMGVLNTTWDDTGENLFNNNWYPLVWGAEVSWKAPTTTVGQGGRIAGFNEAFPRLFYGLDSGSVSRALWTLSSTRSHPAVGGQSDQAFWKRPWQLGSLPDAKPTSGNLAKATMALHQARSIAKRNAETLDAALLACDKTAYLLAQATAVAQIPLVLETKPDMREVVVHDVTDPLPGQLARLKDHYDSAWRLENRPWWLERNLAKYESFRADVEGMATVPMFDPAAGSLKGPTDVKVSNLLGVGEVRYTTDGSLPGPTSALLNGALRLTRSATVRAVCYLPGGQQSPVVSALFTLLSRPARLVTPWQHYGENEASRAFDGLDETYFWSYGSVSAGSSFAVMLDDPDMVAGIRVTTGHPSHPDDTLHAGVLEVSSDGEKWREVAQFKDGVAECEMIGYRVKGVRVRVTQDNGNWLVIREIEIKPS